MSNCLADNGKHRWAYRRQYHTGTKVRQCQKCGVTQEQRGKRYITVSAPWR